MFIVNKMHQFLVFHLLILISLTATLSETIGSLANPKTMQPQQPACAGENCRGLSYGSTGRRCSLYDRCSDSPSYIPRPCDKRCGAVSIEYPFGIGTNCSANEWFTVDCFNSTPYLSAINHVEMLYGGQGTVTVNMSVIKADCKHPIQNTSSVLINTTHGESPFRISGSGNMLVVKGCGNGVIMDENQNIVSGCSTTCSKDTVGDINNCFGVGCCKTTVPFNQESFALNITGLVDDRTCGSAFLVHRDYAERFSDNTFVPISLNYNMETQATCGELEIPFPFWTEETRNVNVTRWFKVDCKSLEPYLSEFNNVRVININLEAKTLLVNVPVISECKNGLQKSSLVLTKSPFVFSKSENVFVVEGCGNAAITLNNGTTVTGCSATCSKDTVIGDAKNCFGDGCCQTTIPDDLKSFNLNLMGWEIHLENGSCAGSAFLVDRGSFTEGSFSRQFVPVTLGWGNNTGDEDSDGLSTACKICRDQGGYCYTDNSGTHCFHPENGRRKKDDLFSKAVILGVSISMGLVILPVIIYALYKIIKRTKATKRRQRFFKRNGGLLLEQQRKPDIGLVDKTILFTSRELEKATDHFNENRILGRGGQGTVYKGMLADGRIVAIKKSKVVDESQLEQFINEVVILSQVNHRNVVKLLGCCLETEVPLLVSEFIPNGTLYDLIHDETDEFPFSFNIRLQIAAEVSGAVSYLHSATSIPIYHRDIKTTNILLDEKYRAKVSDFGTSKFVAINQTHMTTLVKGTLGYMDPEYFQSSQFTEKSDVYSFGVVLLELLTREKPISSTDCGEKRNLATHFLLAMEEGWVMSLFDVTAIKEGSRNELLALANLAMRCLNFNGKNRPTMKEVSIELEGIRLSHVPSTVQTSFGNVKKCEEVPLTYGESSSTSMTYDDNHSL